MENNQEYLKLLAESYPTVRSVVTELINLNAVLNLPKGTEHFISDVHGEYQAFRHIMNNCSGVIREKAELVFGARLSREEISELCTLIYYPAQKLELLGRDAGLADWYIETLNHLVDLCKVLASKYTREQVRKSLPEEYSYIIDELLHATSEEDVNQKLYHKKIFEAIVNTGSAPDFIGELAGLIKVLAVDRLHVVGDIFDRGAHPDKIMEELMNHHNVDIQWGNHDILWMGAAAGSEACIACAVKNSVTAGNYELLESGYGISLRPLALFAQRTYPQAKDLSAAILDAIHMILFKLEGDLLRRNPQFNMEDRRLLRQINYENYTISLDGKTYPLRREQLVTVDPANPERLTPEEQEVMGHLKKSFLSSTNLSRHVKFLYEQGGLYRCCNYNLLFHGCVPMEADGSFQRVELRGKTLWGKAYLDELEKLVRFAFGQKKAPQEDLDILWYLWCGRVSPLYGRWKMTTFERYLIGEESLYGEEKNPYYALCEQEEICEKILLEFGLGSQYSHIINGHVPVRAADGESPVKGGGRLIFIDGGFCRAYQKTTGIAGYTLIYNSRGMRILSHRPFQGITAALENNDDIRSHTDLIQKSENRIMFYDTDEGNALFNKIYMLTCLLSAYRKNEIQPKG